MEGKEKRNLAIVCKTACSMDEWYMLTGLKPSEETYKVNGKKEWMNNEEKEAILFFNSVLYCTLNFTSRFQFESPVQEGIMIKRMKEGMNEIKSLSVKRRDSIQKSYSMTAPTESIKVTLFSEPLQSWTWKIIDYDSGMMRDGAVSNWIEFGTERNIRNWIGLDREVSCLI